MAQVLLDQLSIFNIKSISHFLAQCLVDQIQVQKPILVVATGQIPDQI